MSNSRLIHEELSKIEIYLKKPFINEKKLKELYNKLEKIQLKLIVLRDEKIHSDLQAEEKSLFLREEKVAEHLPNDLLAKAKELLDLITKILNYIDSSCKIAEKKQIHTIIDDGKSLESTRTSALGTYNGETDRVIKHLFTTTKLPAAPATLTRNTEEKKVENRMAASVPLNTEDLLIHILQYIPIHSRAILAPISKSWNSAVKQSPVPDQYIPFHSISKMGIIFANKATLFSNQDSKSNPLTFLALRQKAKRQFLAEFKDIRDMRILSNADQAEYETDEWGCIKNSTTRSICFRTCCFSILVITVIGFSMLGYGAVNKDKSIGTAGACLLISTFGLLCLGCIVPPILGRIRRCQLDISFSNESQRIERDLESEPADDEKLEFAYISARGKP